MRQAASLANLRHETRRGRGRPSAAGASFSFPPLQDIRRRSVGVDQQPASSQPSRLSQHGLIFMRANWKKSFNVRAGVSPPGGSRRGECLLTPGRSPSACFTTFKPLNTIFRFKARYSSSLPPLPHTHTQKQNTPGRSVSQLVHAQVKAVYRWSHTLTPSLNLLRWKVGGYDLHIPGRPVLRPGSTELL